MMKPGMEHFPPKVLGDGSPEETNRHSPHALPQPDSESSRPPAGSDSIFDPDALGKLVNGDLDTIKTILHEFVIDVGIQIQKLKSFLDEGDLAASKIISHTIKGAAAISGAVAMREAAAKIESALYNENMEIARFGFPDLKIQFAELVRHLVDIELLDPSIEEPTA